MAGMMVAEKDALLVAESVLQMVGSKDKKVLVLVANLDILMVNC